MLFHCLIYLSWEGKEFFPVSWMRELRHVLSTLPKIAQLVNRWIIIETLFTLKYGFVSTTPHIVRKDTFRKDSFIRHVKGWKVCLGRAHRGVEIKVGLEQMPKKLSPNWLKQKGGFIGSRTWEDVTKVWISSSVFSSPSVSALSSGSAHWLLDSPTQ